MSYSDTNSDTNSDSDSDPFAHLDEKKDKIDVETGNLSSKICQFCQHKLLETESVVELDCHHVLCRNCFLFFQSKNRKSCPICFKPVSTFDTKKLDTTL